MIPLTLRLSGFLSYRDAVELDFTAFDLACISGPNGAGKSSLLDAITWALFGQARKRDEALVNLQSKAAEVAFTFGYEENIYRVIRTLPRGRTTVLEFQIRGSGPIPDYRISSNDGWRPLTERTLRETQARIEQILRLDYDTFVNAAFFLQGKADQFTQQRAGERKRILGNILGLEVWETYKERTAERRKAIERELDGVKGRIEEIDAELAEEDERKSRLAGLEAQLGGLAAARKSQEAVLENMRRVTASLTEQRKLVASLAAQVEHSTQNQTALEERLSTRQVERGAYADLLARADEVEAAYQAWQSARVRLEEWNSIAEKFREHEAQRAPLVTAIEAERARLEQERLSLAEQEKVISDQRSAVSELQDELEAAQKALEQAEEKVSRRDELGTTAQSARERQVELRAENDRLKAAMDELKARIDKLEVAEGAACPLCGQPLEAQERLSLIDRLKSEGKTLGDAWRVNRATLEELASQITNLESLLATLSSAETDRLARASAASQLTERLENLQRAAADWESKGKPRLGEITLNLQRETFATDSRKKLAKVDKKLAALGYDAAAHDAARRAEQEGRADDEDYRKLESARAALKPRDDEIANLQSQITNLQSAIRNQQSEFDDAAASLAAAESQAPDLESAERALFDLQEQENRLNQEVGAARQKVTILDDLRVRKANLETQGEELAKAIGRHKTLERAFGKDGVPALLIEQALPQIEARANDLLDRLSNGAMSIRFLTQVKYKDEQREDLRETLDIQISDEAGTRDYEMFSGGEAFRVNFAIRLALSEVLAQRKGARLQTLVIDEGFGSQDTQGRQRLIEAINLVRGDFAKILVITHLDELKDVFPTRIEVEKTERGSVVRVI